MRPIVLQSAKSNPPSTELLRAFQSSGHPVWTAVHSSGHTDMGGLNLLSVPGSQPKKKDLQRNRLKRSLQALEATEICSPIAASSSLSNICWLASPLVYGT